MLVPLTVLLYWLCIFSESQLLPFSYTVAFDLLRPLESSNLLLLVILKGPAGLWR